MRIIGVDFGESRTGFAVSDALGFTAQGLDTLKEKKIEKVAQHIAALVKQYEANEIVVGLPKNMNGTIGDRGRQSQRLASILKSECNAKVVLWDERLTTVSAHNVLSDANVRGEKRKNSVDKIAAVLILQTYLDYLNSKR